MNNCIRNTFGNSFYISCMIGSLYLHEFVNSSLHGIVIDFPLQVIYCISMYFFLLLSPIFPCLTFLREMFFHVFYIKRMLSEGIQTVNAYMGFKKHPLYNEGFVMSLTSILNLS